VDLFGKGRGRQGDRFLAPSDRVRAPPMTLGTIGDPFFRFPFANGTDEGKVGTPAQLKSLLKLLSCPTEIFFMEVNLRQNPMQSWKILSLQTNFVDDFKGFIQHLQSQTEFGVKKGNHPMVRIVLKRFLIDTENGAGIFPADVEILQAKDEDD
jgi:hypothetical protein